MAYEPRVNYYSHRRRQISGTNLGARLYGAWHKAGKSAELHVFIRVGEYETIKLELAAAPPGLRVSVYLPPDRTLSSVHESRRERRPRCGPESPC
jgi:hypothetical protein